MSTTQKDTTPPPRWIPITLALTSLASLLGSMILLGQGALISLTLFIILFPVTLINLLVRWWPRHRCERMRNEKRWKRRLNFTAAGVMVAAAINLFAGVNFFGTPLGTTLLVAGTLLLPPAVIMAILSFSLGRADVTRTVLAEDEHLVFQADTHWAIFLPPIQLITLCLLLLMGPFGLGGEVIAAIIYLAVLPGMMARALAIFLNTEVSITDQRMITVTGTLLRRTRVMTLGEIKAAGIYRTFLGRLLGYGKVGIICHNGQSLKLPGIADPETLRDMLDPSGQKVSSSF
ncbi:PH domain-containing protein [Ectothiorhodospira magna]|uniref:PH domain-containing protein n=1 Tax=Ectothiorhodospira magna TaxID=867345 RepID=A0A1H9CC79_9GAMM|nr:PH domain-containing protein [Ectothiorhodospira magna]SEP98754.1 PH domain-containing protein [Ectothiorhodospira magna]